MIDSYGSMKAVTSQTGLAILQNSYLSVNSAVCLPSLVGYAEDSLVEQINNYNIMLSSIQKTFLKRCIEIE